MAAAVALGACVAIVLASCDILLGGPFRDDLPSPSTLAVYSRGTATIAIKGGETITLDQLAPGSKVSSIYGSEVAWTGPSGWHVRVSNAGIDNIYGSIGSNGGYLVLDRVFDGNHWTTLGDARCLIDIEVVDAKAIRGTATCKGVQWFDALLPPFEAGVPPGLDEPKFDAEVTFEAFP